MGINTIDQIRNEINSPNSADNPIVGLRSILGPLLDDLEQDMGTSLPDWFVLDDDLQQVQVDGTISIVGDTSATLPADSFGSLFGAAQYIDTKVVAHTIDDSHNDQYSAAFSRITSDDSIYLQPLIIGSDNATIWNGRAPDSATEQNSFLAGARYSILDHDYGIGVIAPTGRLREMTGAEWFVYHAGPNKVRDITGAYLNVYAQDSGAGTPGAVLSSMTGVFVDIEPDGEIAQVPFMVGYDIYRTDWADANILKSVGFHAPSMGHAGTITSYGILLEDQAGSVNNYAIWTGLGRNVFNDTVIFARHTIPADGDLRAGDAAIWFDQSNGAAKLMVKAKQADGTVRVGSLALT